MKRALLVFFLTGMILLSSCGSTADMQNTSETVSESTEITAADQGNDVSEGKYTIKLEGTLFWVHQLS